MPPNRLSGESSPYLRQHADNPVEWYPWGEEAFARARAEQRPVLLSIGYSSCHWCHVMERESFADPATAALMNELFINIKVDREERPDVDDVYMRAVQLITGRGGWPMTVFLTPDRRPFHAGTYFPPVDRHGLPAFRRVLEAVAKVYRERPAEVDESASKLAQGIGSLDLVEPAPGGLDIELPKRAAAALFEHVDQLFGGLGDAPKFPNSGAFQLLLRRGHDDGRDDLQSAALLTCRRMAEGGIYDQIGGGFHRYSVDRRWLVPHFEKMLYDNALIPRLYTDAWRITREELHARIVRETLEYVLREMRDDRGGFYSATDADSEGEEGRFFVWTPAEVEAVVGSADAALACRYWGITPEGTFEGRSIPHVAVTLEEAARMAGCDPQAATDAIARARAALYAARQRRVPPLRDEKVLAGWNGLMLGTLARSGLTFGEPRWVDAASRTGEFLWREMRRGDRLLHTWFAGHARIPAFLDDHVFVADGFLALFEASGDRQWLQRAVALANDLDRYFHDDDAGGYFFSPSDGEPLLHRPKPGLDGALPSGNGAAAALLLRLHAVVGESRYRDRAEEILRLYHGAAAQNPFGFVSYLEALEMWTGALTEVVIIGDPGPARAALVSAAAQAFVPHVVIVTVSPGDPAPPAVARDRGAPGGVPTAYVCRGLTCSAPVTDAEALAAHLAGQAG